jgi:hypothetical protein
MWCYRYAVAQVVEALCYRPENCSSNPDYVSGFIFQFTSSFQPQYGFGVYLASNGNEYQKIFLVGEERPASKADNLTANIVPII